MKGKTPKDEAKAFERLLRQKPRAEHYLLRLYVTGTTPKSARAIRNIQAICEEQLQGRYTLEVIDVYQHMEGAKAEQIVVTPTLVKRLPLPVRRLIGDLSSKDRVLIGLDLIPTPAAGKQSPPSEGQDDKPR